MFNVIKNLYFLRFLRNEKVQIFIKSFLVVSAIIISFAVIFHFIQQAELAQDKQHKQDTIVSVRQLCGEQRAQEFKTTLIHVDGDDADNLEQDLIHICIATKVHNGNEAFQIHKWLANQD